VIHPERPIQVLNATGDIQLARQFRASKRGRGEGRADFTEFGVVFEDEHIQVTRDPVRFANGSVGSYLRVVEGAATPARVNAVVLPMVGSSVCFLRIFRHPVGSWEHELPRGCGEVGESPEAAARRELLEETGLVADSLLPLGELIPNSGLLTTRVWGFAAICSSAPGSPRHDDAEHGLTTRRVEIADLAAWLAAGEVRDCISLSAIALARARGVLPW